MIGAKAERGVHERVVSRRAAERSRLQSHAVGQLKAAPAPPGVADAGVRDDRAADPAAAHGPHVELQRAVGPRRVGGGEVAPQPRPLRRLDAHVLPRPVGDGLAGLHGDPGQVPAQALVADHPAQPGGGPALGGGRRAHRARDDAVRLGPGGLDLGRELVAREVPDGAQQRDAHRVVVLGEHAELAVVAAELLEERDQLVGPVHHLHHVHERPQQPAALHLHVDGEQVARLGRPAEQRRVEVPRQLLGLRGHQGEARPDQRHHVVDLRRRRGRGDPRGALVGEHLVRGHRVAARGRGARSRGTRFVGGADMVVPFGGTAGVREVGGA